MQGSILGMVERTILFVLVIATSVSGFSQDSVRIVLGPDSSSVSTDTRLIYVYDGVPILNGEAVMDLIDPSTIDSVRIHWRQILDCDRVPIFDAVLEIQSKDTVNIGLKYVLSYMNGWIFRHPLAALYLDGEETDWTRGFEVLSSLDSSSITSVQMVRPNRSGECDYGKVQIRTRR